MIAEKALSLETCRNADQCIIGVSVLVIDCDSTCLTIVSTMLRTCGYNVVTAKRAKDAFSILLERGDELDLILTEVNLPDMDKFELLEKFFEMSSLPVVAFSADDGEGAMLGSLFKGAVLYLVKPIVMNDIKNLWQFLHMKKLDSMVAVEGTNNLQGETSEDNTSSEALESQSVLNNREPIPQQCKRKEFEIMDKDEDSAIHKKPKIRWSNELHNRFLHAIDILGIDDAHPKKILQHMNVPGLRKENVSSHLQKYRLSLKQQEETKNKRGIVDHHPSSVTSEQCQFPQCLNTQAILKACQPEFTSHFLPNVSLSIAPRLGASQSLHNQDSSHISYVPEFGEFDSKTNQPYVPISNAAHVESRTAGSWELTNSGQMRNHEAEHFLRQKTDPSNIRHSVSKSAFLGQEMSLPVPQPPPPQQEQEDNNPENETETTQL
ncbi:hypothetical protein K2173_013375 [Erythroxylum novogranatense]|uniref:Two-component response regulator n=1 Tax=Erythroxylum novogranatense TaxID=1862640 RepID=A0AAV8SA74_9ROSI|nr:hypothetical protein K2173_013375 [Erythroxylum novogranatense]